MGESTNSRMEQGLRGHSTAQGQNDKENSCKVISSRTAENIHLNQKLSREANEIIAAEALKLIEEAYEEVVAAHQK